MEYRKKAIQSVQASANYDREQTLQRRDSYGTWDFLTDIYDASTYAASTAYNQSFEFLS